MQETRNIATDERILEEFYSDAKNSREDLINQMDHRLEELKPKGHVLVSREFYQKTEQARKNKRKRERKARRNNR